MKIFLTLFLIFFSLIPCFAADIIRGSDTSLEGKIVSYSDGLIHLRANGMEFVITRSKDVKYYGDYIKYRPNAFSGSVTETYCRLVFVDFYNVIFETSGMDRIKIPKYRIKTIILDID